jgi:hypothetical protein
MAYLQLRKLKLLAAFFPALLAGCASSPYSTDALRGPDRIELQDQQQIAKLSYLGRFILDAQDRDKLSAKIDQTYRPSVGDTSSASAAVGMATAQIVNGSTMSVPGRETAGTVFVALRTIDMFMPDGSMSISGGLYLPDVWDGHPLDTPEDALQAAWSYVDKRIRESAKATGRSVECTGACEDKTYRAYLLTQKDTLATDYRFTYNPKYILMEYRISPDGMQPYKADPREIWALGFTPKWYAGDGRMAFPLFREVDVDENLQPKKNKDGSYAKNSLRPHDVHIGRELLRTFYDDGGYGFYITNEFLSSKVMSYRGKLYGFLVVSDRRFIEYELKEQDVLAE